VRCYDPEVVRRAGPPSPIPPRIKSRVSAGIPRVPPAARPASATAKARRAPEPEPPPKIDREGAITPLRLAIGKDGLGIELAGPTTLACLEVVELVVRLPHVKFPFDVSGGVARFRHKRGELERLAVELDARRVARWAEPRLRGLLSAGPCTVVVEPRAFGATVTIHARASTGAPAPGTRMSALAFEVALVPSHAELAIAVHSARGAHLVEPATSLAIRAVDALLGDAARR
jgi:hypothetical protein